MKAGERRRRQKDLERRRCPECRNRRLAWLEELAWCENCGWIGALEDAPYQQWYRDHLILAAEAAARRKAKESQ